MTGAALRRVPAALAVLALAAGCATSSPKPASVPPPDTRPPVFQTGQASWYGERHHGHRTANGEHFDMFGFTAAHPTLPLGTRLLVTNLRNGRSVEVRVNDRGPVTHGRIIDLSYAAAERLGAIGDGVIRVSLRIVSLP